MKDEKPIVVKGPRLAMDDVIRNMKFCLYFQSPRSPKKDYEKPVWKKKERGRIW